MAPAPLRLGAPGGPALAAAVSGDGPPLLLVHGTGGDGARWDTVKDALGARRTLYALDRRGRGGSADAADYAIAGEFADMAGAIAALAARHGGAIDVLAHSYGALCTLEGAITHAPPIRRLVLYEPPLPVAGPITPPALIERLQVLAAAGKREDVLLAFLNEIVRVPAAELAALRASPAWANRIAAAHTIPRELAALQSYRFDPDRAGRLTSPTLLLLGGDSPAFLKRATEALHAALPGSALQTLPGQQHNAMMTAPAPFSRAVLDFLDRGAA